jgi:DeoR family ulaG and ulaABCDEF operon transcriptional repressor
MLERERKSIIRSLLDLHTFVNIHDIVDATGASEATIRRDFIEMEEEKILRRVRGGVELAAERNYTSIAEPSLDRRLSVNREKKRRIAKKACAYIEADSTVIIDGGSTTFHMTEFLASLAITVVTNSFAIAEYLIKHSKCRVILPEGTIYANSQLIINNLSADPFANYNASVAFMGVEGISASVLTNSDPLLIQMERSIIAHARDLVILADESKFGKIGHLTLCPVEKASRIITSNAADQDIVDALREKGIDVVQV